MVSRGQVENMAIYVRQSVILLLFLAASF